MYNKIIAFLAGILLFINAFSQSDNPYSVLITEAESFYNQQKYASSLEKYEQAFLRYADNEGDLYNGACSAAMAGKPERAFELLNNALDKGWSNVEHLEKDCDLYSLHFLPGWADVLEKAKSNVSKQKTSSLLVTDVATRIEKNKADELWDFCSDGYKAKISKEDLVKEVQRIYDLLQFNHITGLGSLMKSQSTSMNITNGIVEESGSVSYAMVPKYFGGYSEGLSVQPVEYQIIISFRRNNKVWELDGLKLEKNYGSAGDNQMSYAKDFFTSTDSVFLRFEYVNSGKIISGLSPHSNAGAFGYIAKELNGLTYIPLDSVFLNHNSNKIFALSLYKRGKKEVVPLFDSYQVPLLEFIFYDDKGNVVMISNGSKHAFYQMKDTGWIKKIVLGEINSYK